MNINDVQYTKNTRFSLRYIGLVEIRENRSPTTMFEARLRKTIFKTTIERAQRRPTKISRGVRRIDVYFDDFIRWRRWRAKLSANAPAPFSLRLLARSQTFTDAGQLSYVNNFQK